MFVTTFLVASVVVLLIYWKKQVNQHFSYWQNLGIPCDPPSVIRGNLQEAVISKPFVTIFQEFYDKYRNCKPFAGYYWFLKHAIFVTDPNLIKQILIKDFSKFADRGFFHNEDDDPLSGHLFNLDGAKWRNMRNKLSPTFTSGKMKIMYPLVVGVGEQLVKVLAENVERSNIVEIKDLLIRYTTDVIGSSAFGLEINSLEKSDTKFSQMSRKALVERRGGTLGIAFRLSFPEFSKRLHFKETIPDVEEFFLNIVRDTVDYREQNNVKRNDFMDMLIDLKNNKLMKSKTSEEMTNLTFGEIAAQAFIFLLAGFETSSTTMGFALYELAQHDDIQQKAREEVKEVLRMHNNEFSYECVKKMVYLKQVISETLRLYTVVPLLHRLAMEDYVVPGHSNFIIKKGMVIMIPAAAIHRDERYYPQPNIFNPDNFTPEKVAERDSVLYLPFGDGPRNCIGMRFGKMQTLVGLALLLLNFKFTICKETPIPIKYDLQNFLTSSEGGIYLKVEKV